MPGQVSLPLIPTDQPTFDTFYATPENAVALTLVRSWPDWPSPIIALVGPEGTGKTHLGRAWQAKSLGVFLDGAETCAETELFKTINLALSGDIPGLLLASRTAPKQWAVDLPDLRSRLNAVPTMHLSEPIEEDLEPILRAIFKTHGRRVSRDVVSYILAHTDRAIPALKALVVELDRAAQAERADITRHFTSQFIKRRSERDVFAVPSE